MKLAIGLSKIKWPQIAIVAILLLATILRFYALDRADVLTDEASVSFRSIGYFDWLATPYQTTPLEWLSSRPTWTYLSFHDHPPFSFLLQFLQFKITGVSILTMRFWPALYGVLSVWLVYLIGRRLFSNSLGLLAAGLLAVNNLHIWISRLALQESLVVLLILTSFYWWLKFLENRKYFYWLGLFIGLSLLAKLTAIILLPIIFGYLIFWRKDILRWREFYWAVIIALAVWSPYWVYNIILYQNFGHFDFQLSWLLGQPVEAWQQRPGRTEVPNKSSALFFIFGGLKYSLSPIFFWLVNLSLVAGIIKLFKDKFSDKNFSYLLWIILSHLILLIFIGSSARFLALLTPWLCLLLAYALLIWHRYFSQVFMIIILCLIFVVEVFYSYNTNINYVFWGKKNITYSPLKSQAYPYGYNQLENYFDNLLSNQKPAVLLSVVNPNINNFIKEQVAKNTGQPQAKMVIYDQRLQGESLLWFFTRRFFYQGWPMLPYDTYQQALSLQGEDLFRQLGIKDFYYVMPTDVLPLDLTNEAANNELVNFVSRLQEQGIQPQKIFNHQGKLIFEVYHFN